MNPGPALISPLSTDLSIFVTSPLVGKGSRCRVNQTMLSVTTVEWYSGYTLYDRPRRFLWKRQWLEVITVLERGYVPDGAYIKILASDHGIYRLEYSLDQDVWHVAASV